MATQKDDREKYLEAQIIEEQVKQLQKYLETFDQQLLEVKELVTSIKELEKLKKGDSILAPVANGIFMKAKVDDNSHLLINVGGQVVTAKTVPEAVKMLEGQEAELTKYRGQALANLEELMKRIEDLH